MSRAVLSASAIVMAALGMAGSFAPVELANAAGLDAEPIVVQLLAALLFAFAMVNWMARGSLLGGIYNRPLAVGNLAHFVIGALALAKATGAGERRPALILAAAVYALFAIAFALLLFRSPVKSSDLPRT